MSGGAQVAAALAQWPAFSPLVRIVQPAADFLQGGQTTAAVGTQAGQVLSLGAASTARVAGRGIDRAMAWAGFANPGAASRAVESSLAGIKAGARSVGSSLGAAARIVGRLAPFFNVMASSWDTAKAFAENDPDYKRQAVANAVVSWAGTLMVIGALFLGATPLGIGLAAGATAIAGAQLIDNLFFDGGGTRVLGDLFKRG